MILRREVTKLNHCYWNETLQLITMIAYYWQAVDRESCEPEGIDLDLVGQMKEMTIGDEEEEVRLRNDGQNGTVAKTSIFDKSVASTKVGMC